MIHFGLCCTFQKAPIRFRVATATYLQKLGKERLPFLAELILDNAAALEHAIFCCEALGIASFRINSRFFPAYTHPDVGYTLDMLPKSITKALKKCRTLAREHAIRLTFHPDQFVVLSTPHEEVLDKSLEEIEYQALLADLIGADVINIHAGGAYGDKKEALKRFESAFKRLSNSAKKKLTLENDDKSYTPADLLPLCRRLQIPFVYDVHHHRCLPDGLAENEVTEQALKTWNREPLFHLSSPLNGWDGPTPFKHHNYIDPRDFPKIWLKIDPLTVEIEAKAKELAILKLMKDLCLHHTGAKIRNQSI